ncbi:MAG: hypothetical protein WCS30_02350 [Selenomonadaceae bacterium]
MSIEIKGYYTLPTTKDPKIVDFKDVFNTSFMRKYSHYKSFEKFLQGGKFNIKSQKDFEMLPEEQMDQHVKKHTIFSSWQEMLNFATDKYILQQNPYSPPNNPLK